MLYILKDILNRRQVDSDVFSYDMVCACTKRRSGGSREDDAKQTRHVQPGSSKGPTLRTIATKILLAIKLVNFDASCLQARMKTI
jgi:hypothetical protein